MGGSPCCDKEGLNRGAWTTTADKILIDYIQIHGEGKWRRLSKRAGLKRGGKSCRLRWVNYLRPGIKRGNITHDEEDLIIRLHNLLGNRWSLIAGRLPGRTDNEIKNYWYTYIRKKFENANSKSPTTSIGVVCSTTSLSRQDSDPKISLSSCVVRPKATRCTKVIVSKEIQPLMAAPSSTHDMNNVRRDHEKMEVPPSGYSDGITNNYLFDFMADFEIDESIFPDLLNMDISESSCFAQKLVGDSNASTSEQGCHFLSPRIFNDTCLNVFDDSLHGFGDFQSMSDLVENEFHWL